MGRKILWVDDLDPSGDTEADQTDVRFSFQGTDYLIDLSSDNFEQMCAEFGKWIEHARRAEEFPGPSSGGGTVRKLSAHDAPPPDPSSGREFWWITPKGAGYHTKKAYQARRRELREWGERNGYHVTTRGQIPEQLAHDWARRVFYGGEST